MVERPGDSLDARFEELLLAASGSPPDPDGLCEAILAAMLPNGSRRDDAALVAVRQDVNLLFELAERLGTHQLRLAVVVPEGGLVDRVLTIVDLGAVAELRRTLEDAVAALGR